MVAGISSSHCFITGGAVGHSEMAEPNEFEDSVAEVENLLENSALEQEKLLRRLVETHAGCEYLKKYDVKDTKSFKNKVPVIEYDAIVQDIQRIVNGDTSHILCCSKVEELWMSSGTTSGKRKTFPVTNASFDAYFRLGARREDFMRASSFGDAGGLTLPFLCVSKQERSSGGLPMGSASASIYRRPGFLDKIVLDWTSPAELVLCENYQQSMYTHLLCGLLRHLEVTNFFSIFVSTLATAISFLQQAWEELCTDLETGQLSDRITDPPVRAAVSKLLARPNPQLADLIRAECSKDSWKGILVRLWPNAKFISCIATGAMELYVDNIDFLSGGLLPILSTVYAGSEGSYGINPCISNPPSQAFYVLMPDLVFFEFLRREKKIPDLPQNADQETAHIVDLANVEQGQEYQLLITNGTGLWRFQVGDILKCVGFFHNAPKFQFVGRNNVILSINTDKTEEQELLHVVNKAAKLHLSSDIQLSDFTSTVCLTSVPGRYVIYWQVTTTVTGKISLLSVETMQESCLTMENALSEPYRRGRNLGVIDPLELRVVEPGSFAKISLLAQRQGTSMSQYKTPRAFKPEHPALDILDASVTHAARSHRLPFHPTLNPRHPVS